MYIKLAIVEDNVSYQAALQAYVNTVPELELVGTAYNLQRLPQIIAARPDVVIMDIDLGKESGIQGIKILKEALPHTNILMLTVFEDEEKILGSIKAGAVGYLLKKDPPEKIVEAVRSVHRGEGAINGQVARTLMEYIPKPENRTANLEAYNLTRREKEILLLLIEGFSYKEIAAQCFISIDTMNSHIRKIYSKLNIHSRSEIAARLR